MSDSDVYKNGTLRNLLGITDARTLRRYEYRITAARSLWLLQHGLVIKNSGQLPKIHRFLFEGIYRWAGKVRDYELSKGGTQFMLSEELDNGFRYIDSLLSALPSGPVPVKDYARLLDSLNYLHPFREGNGRTTRLFLQLLGLQHLQVINYQKSLHALIRAERDSDLDALSNLMNVQNVPDPLKARRMVENHYSRQQGKRPAPKL